MAIQTARRLEHLAGFPEQRDRALILVLDIVEVSCWLERCRIGRLVRQGFAV
jgi:hypothetical protein